MQNILMWQTPNKNQLKSLEPSIQLILLRDTEVWESAAERVLHMLQRIQLYCKNRCYWLNNWVLEDYLWMRDKKE